MSYLIDTNVISELRKPIARRNPGVQRWFDQVESGELFLSVLVVGEIRKGIETKRSTDTAQASALDGWLSQLVQAYAERILPVSLGVAERWGRARTVRSFPVIDGLMAATAQEHGMKLVTRNVGDLTDWPYPGLLLNPFELS